jgi:hypothetical protein
MQPEEASPKREQWHVEKGVPLAVLFTLIVQTGGGIWWLAQVSSKIDYAVQTLQTFQNERYTKEDGRHDREYLTQSLTPLQQKDAEFERRIQLLEDARNLRGLR